MEYSCVSCYLTAAIKIVNELAEEYYNTSTDISTEQFDLSRQIAEDLAAVLKEAKSMGCKEVKYFYNIPLKNVETVIKALRAYKGNVSGNSIGWISVEERLPEESLNSVLGWDEYRERCCFVQYIGGRWVLGNDDESVKITAWQPLPESYKGLIRFFTKII